MSIAFFFMVVLRILIKAEELFTRDDSDHVSYYDVNSDLSNGIFFNSTQMQTYYVLTQLEADGNDRTVDLEEA